MAISVISVSSDSLDGSIRTPGGRVILFGTIPTTLPDTTPTVTPPATHIDTTLIPAEIPIISPIIPSYPDYILVSLDYSPTSNTEFNPSKDPSSDHIPPLPATSPFISSTDDSSDSDTPDTPPSPTHGTPFTKITLSTQRSPAASGALYMMTARKRVRLLRTYCLTLRHSVDYSLLYPFTFDDSSETSLGFSSDDLSDSSSGHSSLDHSSPALPSCMRSSHQLCSLVPTIPHSSAITTERPCHSSFIGPSRKRSRSPTTFVPRSSPIPGVLPPARADLLPPRKRIRSFDYATYLEDCLDESCESSLPRETSLRDDVVVRGSGPVKVRVERVTHPAVPNDVPKPAREEGAVKVTYETLGDLVQRFHDRDVEILVHRVQVIKGIQRDQWYGIVATGQHCAVLLERISELEQDNTRLRGTLDVASQRVSRLQRGETMPNTRSGATMTREIVNELIEGQVAEDLEAHDDTRNLEPLVEGGGEQGDENGDDYEGRNRGVNGNGRNGNGKGNDNGNGNGNEGGNGYNFGGLMHVAKECTYQDFLKYQPLNFNGTKGVVGLTRWFEKMEMVFHISNCPQKYQVKYATYTLLNSALPWWNSHKRAIRFEAEYAMTWTEFMKLMTEVRFQELVSLCTRMVLNEEDKVERFIGGWPDNIQGNVIAAEAIRIQDAIRVANNLMDQSRHFRKDYPKLKNKNRGNKTRNMVGNKTRSNEATAKAYAIGGGANPESNVVTSTFLLNNWCASMLFDFGADRSFVSSTFSALLDVAPGCMLGLLGHPFYIDLMLVELGSFNVIIGMDCKSKLNIISSTKTQKYIYKGCQVYLEQVTSKMAKDKSDEKRLEDVPIVREFSEVFPEDLPGLPPA
nr:hypothetical protein [Tanacetum cinerariifolium]